MPVRTHEEEDGLLVREKWGLTKKKEEDELLVRDRGTLHGRPFERIRYMKHTRTRFSDTVGRSSS